jgi:hypothetical protein
MKQVLIICTSLFILINSSFAQTRNIENLMGSWECIDQKDDRGSFEFLDSSKVYFTYMGEKKEVVNYKVDFSKTPYWFSLTLKDEKETIDIKSFLYFIDDNNIKWEVVLVDEGGKNLTDNTTEIVMLRRKGMATASR